MNEHSKVIEFGSKANADSYIAAGWELMETRSGQNYYLLTSGLDAGEPVRPPTDDDLRDLRERPSAN